MLPPSSVRSVLLLVVTCLSYGVSGLKETHIDYRRPITVQITCCTTVSTANIKFPIVSYKIQQVANRCVYAVIFRTEANGSFCADPKARWVQKKVKELSGGTVQLPKRGKGKKGGKGGKRGKKQNNKNKKKIQKKNTKPQGRPSARNPRARLVELTAVEDPTACDIRLVPIHNSSNHCSSNLIKE